MVRDFFKLPHPEDVPDQEDESDDDYIDDHETFEMVKTRFDDPNDPESKEDPFDRPGLRDE